MPFLLEISPAAGVRAGIWRITETAEELLAKVLLNASETTLYASFKHELRKRQWLAYRVLLKHLLAPLGTELSYDPNGKPFLDSLSHHISVSHAGEFAAVAVSDHAAVGVDIEIIKERIERVRERFLQKTEMESLASENRLEQLYVYWGGKEALYKIHGEPAIDFRNDIYIHPFDYLCNTNQYCKAELTVNGMQKDYTLYFKKTEDFMLVLAF